MIYKLTHRLIQGFKLRLAALLLLSTVLVSCSEDVDTGFSLISERVLYASSDIVRLSGRVVSTVEVDVSEHGFEISTDPGFAGAEVLNLGTFNGPGAFLGELNSLDEGTDYFWRPFIVVEGETTYGETLSVETLDMRINDFTPGIGLQFGFVDITGNNFPENVRVFFGDNEANVVRRIYDSNIRVQVPQIGSDYIVPIRVLSDTKELVFDTDFEYVIGEWNTVSVFPETKIFKNFINLRVGDEVVFGLGKISNNPTDRVWVRDLPTGVWTEIGYPGPPVWEAFDAGPYFGGGVISNPPFPGAFPILTDELYKYENGAITLESTMPFEVRNAKAFLVGADLIVMGGFDEALEANTMIWKYDTVNKTWENIGENFIPFNNKNAGFTYNSKVYVVLDGGLVVRYDPTINFWEFVTVYPENIASSAISQLDGDEAYIGFAAGRRSLYVLDLVTNTWKPKNSSSLPPTFTPLGSWFYDGSLSVLIHANGGTGFEIKTWEFDPDAF